MSPLYHRSFTTAHFPAEEPEVGSETTFSVTELSPDGTHLQGDPVRPGREGCYGLMAPPGGRADNVAKNLKMTIWTSAEGLGNER